MLQTRIFLIGVFLSTFLLMLAQNPQTNAVVENYSKLDPGEAVRAILIDKQNFKWLGTDKGLYRLISIDSDPELISSDSITGLTEDKKELVWYGNRKQQLTTEDQAQTITLGATNAKISCMTYYKETFGWAQTRAYSGFQMIRVKFYNITKPVIPN